MCPLNRPDLGESGEKLQKIRSQCIRYLSENDGALKMHCPGLATGSDLRCKARLMEPKGKYCKVFDWLV